MGIKQQIETMINNIPEFALIDAGEAENERFKNLALDFLKPTPYKDASERANIMMKFALDIHAKTETMGPIIETMRDFELKNTYNYKKHQRTHYLHSANNLLLGLYLYHGCFKIKTFIEDEMTRTSQNFYSGGTVQGEFLYRWRLCSLCHDIGYPISLLSDETYLNNFLKDVFEIEKIQCLINVKVLPNNETLLDSVLNLNTYIDKKKNNPSPGNEKFDHGIMGGLIFLYKMDKLFSRNRDFEVPNGKRINWNREKVFNTSIKQVANAVATHNLEMHEEALKESLKKPANCKIYDIEKDALSWLLKVTDILQEWDKPKVEDYNEKELTESPDLEIKTEQDSIVVNGFDSNKKKEIKEKFNKYFEQTDIVNLM